MMRSVKLIVASVLVLFISVTHGSNLRFTQNASANETSPSTPPSAQTTDPTLTAVTSVLLALICILMVILCGILVRRLWLSYHVLEKKCDATEKKPRYRITFSYNHVDCHYVRQVVSAMVRDGGMDKREIYNTKYVNDRNEWDTASNESDLVVCILTNAYTKSPECCSQFKSIAPSKRCILLKENDLTLRRSSFTSFNGPVVNSIRQSSINSSSLKIPFEDVLNINKVAREIIRYQKSVVTPSKKMELEENPEQGVTSC